MDKRFAFIGLGVFFIILLNGFASAQSETGLGDVFTQLWDFITGARTIEETTTTVTTTIEAPVVKESIEEGSIGDSGIATQEVTTSLPYHETKESVIFEVVPVEEYNISIYPGWNFISTPYQLVNETLDSFLENVDGEWNNMVTHDKDRCRSEQEYWCVNIAGFIYQINKISNLQGYWINVSQNDNITAIGIHYYKEISIPLYKSDGDEWNGWNIIGYPRNHTVSAMNLTNASLGSNWTLLETYENGEWEIADERIPQILWSLKNVTPGRAYYIKMIEDDTLVIPETTRPY